MFVSLSLYHAIAKSCNASFYQCCIDYTRPDQSVVKKFEGPVKNEKPVVSVLV